MTKLLTQQDLAERWQVDVATITNYRKDGIIVQCKGIPAIRFSEQQILEIEGVKLEKISLLQFRKLERNYELVLTENERLKGILANILAESSKVLSLKEESK